MPVTVEHKKLVKLDAYLKGLTRRNDYKLLEKYGQAGVRALSDATPKDTGKTAESWSYKITKIQNGQYRLEWFNENRKDGVPIALVIYYGHVTKGGGFIEGVDYINPALEPIIKQMANEAWEEVRKR